MKRSFDEHNEKESYGGTPGSFLSRSRRREIRLRPSVRFIKTSEAWGNPKDALAAVEIKRLGFPRSLDPRRYTAASAAHEIAPLLRDSGCSRRAAQVAATVSKENGVQAACDLLTGLIAKSETRRHGAAGRSMTCKRLS